VKRLKVLKKMPIVWTINLRRSNVYILKRRVSIKGSCPKELPQRGESFSSYSLKNGYFSFKTIPNYCYFLICNIFVAAARIKETTNLNDPINTLKRP
jgi:hypothetical protein